MAKREFLQLAHTYDPKKHGIAGWYLSEKLDGMRAFWDGGLSRGKLCSQIPWANVEKHSRFVVQPIATGLWTRYGQPIHAPEEFLRKLPPVMLDGELYAGRGKFQHVVSAVKKLEPVKAEWEEITYMVFDAPRMDEVFADGAINNINFKKTLKSIVGTWAEPIQPPPNSGFETRLKFLKAVREPSSTDCWLVLNQTQLPFKTSYAQDAIKEFLEGILERGGEGVILKSPSCLWRPERSHNMLKHKAVHDAEGTIIGYTWGRDTDKGSKLLGLMGALIVQQDNGRKLELSGFTNAEREMAYCHPARQMPINDYGSLHPGQIVDTDAVFNPMFPLGSRVTYKFRELTDDGVAKEARYYRKPG